MMEFLQSFFTALGFIWVMLMILGFKAMRESQEERSKTQARVNGVTVNMEDVVVAEAEFVEQNDNRVWLLWDYHTKKFLAQSINSKECVNILKERYPNKTIVIKGLPE
jgi:hypothetical protein